MSLVNFALFWPGRAVASGQQEIVALRKSAENSS